MTDLKEIKSPRLLTFTTLHHDDIKSLVDKVTHLEHRIAEMERLVSDMQIDRAYIMSVTGWSRQTLWRKDKEYNIFAKGERTTSFLKFNTILSKINGEERLSIKQPEQL